MASEKEKGNFWGEMLPDDVWGIYLNEGMPGLMEKAPGWFRAINAVTSGIFRALPSDPRCIWCDAPFRGAGAPLMRAIGRDQSKLNPNLCIDCERVIHDNGGGVEVDLTMLFADVRGSTQLAEQSSPSEFKQLIDRFYTVATEKLILADALIDKLIGDEVTAFFVPGLAGPQHPRRAVEAAQEVLRATGHADADGPWVPVGIGIHSGVAYVGIVGHANGMTDITVLGDVANTASRLASVAETGEIITSAAAAERAELDTHELAQRELALKGKSEALNVYVLQVDAPEPVIHD
jgi:adenylate cyclase